MPIYRMPISGRRSLVVLLVSFLVITLSSGGLFGSNHVLYKMFTEYFNRPELSVSWIRTTQLAAAGLSGLVAGPLTQKFGERPVVIGGSLSSALGLIISMVVPYRALYLTLGVITGFGLGVMNLAALTIVHKHFHRHRSLAMGLALCGVVVGTFAWAPLTASLLECYSLPGTLLLLSAFQLQGVWCGALLRRFPISENFDSPKSTPENISKFGPSAASERYELVTPPTYFTSNFSAEESLSQNRPLDSSQIPSRHRPRTRPKMTRPLSTSFVERRRHRLDVEDNRRKRASLDIEDLIRKLSAPTGLDSFSPSTTGDATRRLTSPIDYSESSLPNQNRSATTINETTSQRSIFIDFIEDVGDEIHAHSENSKVSQKSAVKRYTWGAFETDFNALDYKDYFEVIDEKPEFNDSQPTVVYRVTGDTSKPTSMTGDNFHSPTKTLVVAPGLNLFADLPYVFFILGSILESVTFLAPLQSLLMSEEDLTQVVLAIFAVSNVVVRVVAGVVGDRFQSQRCWICASAMCVTGVVSACAALAHHHVTVIIYAAGLATGAAFYLVLKLCIIVDLWGTPSVSLILGHLFACAGVASLLTNPLSSFLMTLPGSFKSLVVVYGCLQVFGGCSVFITTVLKVRQAV